MNNLVIYINNADCVCLRPPSAIKTTYAGWILPLIHLLNLGNYYYCSDVVIIQQSRVRVHFLSAQLLSLPSKKILITTWGF
jgi:hypothetical protein